jgi:hypothetical protein
MSGLAQSPVTVTFTATAPKTEALLLGRKNAQSGTPATTLAQKLVTFSNRADIAAEPRHTAVQILLDNNGKTVPVMRAAVNAKNSEQLTAGLTSGNGVISIAGNEVTLNKASVEAYMQTVAKDADSGEDVKPLADLIEEAGGTSSEQDGIITINVQNVKLFLETIEENYIKPEKKAGAMEVTTESPAQNFEIGFEEVSTKVSGLETAFKALLTVVSDVLPTSEAVLTITPEDIAVIQSESENYATVFQSDIIDTILTGLDPNNEGLSQKVIDDPKTADAKTTLPELLKRDGLTAATLEIVKATLESQKEEIEAKPESATEGADENKALVAVTQLLAKLEGDVISTLVEKLDAAKILVTNLDNTLRPGTDLSEDIQTLQAVVASFKEAFSTDDVNNVQAMN